MLRRRTCARFENLLEGRPSAPSPLGEPSRSVRQIGFQALAAGSRHRRFGHVDAVSDTRGAERLHTYYCVKNSQFVLFRGKLRAKEEAALVGFYFAMAHENGRATPRRRIAEQQDKPVARNEE